jgi:alkylation response protein AidB-like acyl-CoA dehydrogenase
MNNQTLPGGAFVLRDAAPDAVFTPEAFSSEARMMGRAAEDFLKAEVLPHIERIEGRDIQLMAELMRKAGEAGLLGAEIPEAYGGFGLDMRTGALIAEKLNWQQSFALSHEAHTVIATLPLMFFGSHALKSKYLPKLASGEWIGAFGLSEAGSGSDALGAQTKAVLSEDGKSWVLNGGKMWITNTAFASLFTVFAKVDGQKFSAFMVEAGTPGLTYGKEEHKLGMKGTSTRRLILENVTIPYENLVGEVGKGHYAAFCALNLGRFKLEAGAVGGIKETLAVCAAYANQRKQFGRTLGSFGMVQAKLGSMAARLFALESAVYRLAGELDSVFDGIDPTADDASHHYHRAGEEYAIECSVVKVVGSELYSWATDEAIQIHGGYGYTEEFPVARAWRDQRLLRIGEGANEIVRPIIVNTLLRRAKQGRLDLEAQETTCGLKRAGLALLKRLAETFDTHLGEEQEALGAVSDILCAAYCLESAKIRAGKLGGSAADLANTAVALYEHESRTAAVGFVAMALARSGVCDDSLCALIAPDPAIDAIALRRTLAAAVLQTERYPWA